MHGRTAIIIIIVTDEEMDNDQGILMINLIADFWDLMEQYKLLQANETTTEAENVTPHKPSCSVVIKYMKELGDIYFAHNTWHEYRAMSFRYIKKQD